MRIKGILIGAVVSGLAGAGAANATCTTNPTGAWRMFAIETHPGASSKATSITCDIGFETGGAFHADCSSYHTGQNAVDSGPVTGQITMGTSCDFTGSITIPGDSKVMIQDGHINGNIGSGIATQKTGTQTRVLLFNLLKR